MARGSERSRRSGVVVRLAILFPVVSCGSPDHPNIVIVIADTMRADSLGCYGNPHDPTPELDELAEQGVRFARVIAPSSWTKPSIAALITGQHPRTLGVYEEEDEVLPDPFVTLAEHLKESGYRTVGITANPMINAAFRFHQGFDVYINSVDPASRGIGSSNTRLAPARAVFKKALKHARDVRDPCYLQLDVMEMHEYWRGPASLTRPEYREDFEGARDAAYLQAARQVSHDVREFLDELLALPGWEDTLVVFVSDHGEGLTSHGGIPFTQYHGAVLYESNVAVPWIVHHHGGSLAARVVERPVRLIDVAPTILDHLDLPPLDDVAGRSVAPWMTGVDGEVDLPEMFVAETYYRDYLKQAVFGGDWNYYDHRDGHAGLSRRELQAAGGEEIGARTDRSTDHADVVEARREFLRAWEKSTPKRPPTLRAEALPSELESQLRGIGYLGGPKKTRKDRPGGSSRDER